MLLLREFDGMQEKTPLWLALTRAMSSELTVVSAAAGGGRLSENTMRTLEDGGRVSPDAADGLAEDDGATSTSCNYRTFIYKSHRWETIWSDRHRRGRLFDIASKKVHASHQRSEPCSVVAL